MNWLEWYNTLAKPSWTPAPATIGLIWQILYLIIIVSFGFVFVQAIRGKVPWLVALPEYLGVSPNTLRNWEKAGKIVAHRHPVNSYRLFKKEELDTLLRQSHDSASDTKREEG